jgi:hypothetical protein
MMERSTDLSPAWRRADEDRVDAQLLAIAAEEAERLAPACEGWPADRFQALAFSAALIVLKGTLGPYAYSALRRRYDADRTGFTSRLAARDL